MIAELDWQYTRRKLFVRKLTLGGRRAEPLVAVDVEVRQLSSVSKEATNQEFIHRARTICSDVKRECYDRRCQKRRRDIEK